MTPGEPFRENAERIEPLDEIDPGLDIGLLQRRRDRTLAILAVGLLAVVMAGTAFWVLRSRVPGADELRAIAQDAVRHTVQDQAGPNLVCRFGEDSETHIERIAEDAYDVSAEVAAIGPDGRVKRFAYVCTVKHGPDGGWQPVKVTLTPM